MILTSANLSGHCHIISLVSKNKIPRDTKIKKSRPRAAKRSQQQKHYYISETINRKIM